MEDKTFFVVYYDGNQFTGDTVPLRPSERDPDAAVSLDNAETHQAPDFPSDPSAETPMWLDCDPGHDGEPVDGCWVWEVRLPHGVALILT